MSRALVLTYHAIEEREGPLFVDPQTFSAHLDAVLDSGADSLTISELASAVRDGSLRRPAVAITFDDGAESVARVAAPMLAERGLKATVFCVAGHVGGTSAWPSASPGAPIIQLATREQVRALAEEGLEVGCHGMTHAPLGGAEPATLELETASAQELLQDVAGAPILAFAYPYGDVPGAAARRLLARRFASAWTTRAAFVGDGVDLHAAPRVDAHYLRRPALLRAALRGSLGPYVYARRVASTLRRSLRPDYAAAGDGR